MKKYYVFLAVLVIAISSCKKEEDEVVDEPTPPTEFTINAADFGIVGDTFYLAKDFSSLDTLLPTSIDGIWDYSGLTEDEADTNIFYSPDEFAAGTDFPDANIAFNMSSGIAFAIKTDEMIEVIGFYVNSNGMDFTIPFDDHLIMYKFPIKKGGSFTDTGYGSTTTTIDYGGVPMPVDIEISIEINSEIKEEGEMKLNTSSAKCLSEYKVTISNILATSLGQELLNQTDTVRNYNFYASGKGTIYVSAELNVADDNYNNVTFLK